MPRGEPGDLLATSLRLVGRHVREVLPVLLAYWAAVAVLAALLARRPGAAHLLSWMARCLAAPVTGALLIPVFGRGLTGREGATRTAWARIPDLFTVHALVLAVACGGPAAVGLPLLVLAGIGMTGTGPSLPFLLAVLLLAGTVVFLLGQYLPAAPACLLEGREPADALRRAWRLGSLQRPRLLVCYAVPQAAAFLALSRLSSVAEPGGIPLALAFVGVQALASVWTHALAVAAWGELRTQFRDAAEDASPSRTGSGSGGGGGT